MADKELSLDTSLREILEAKEKHHMEQLKFHKDQLSNVRNFLNQIPPDLTNDSDENVSIDLAYLRSQTWEPLILELLNSNGSGLKSTDILDMMKPVGYKREYRRKYILTIAQALSKLKTARKVVGVKTIGEKGDLYKLKLKEDEGNTFEEQPILRAVKKAIPANPPPTATVGDFVPDDDLPF